MTTIAPNLRTIRADELTWEITGRSGEDMLVKARVYADEGLWEAIQHDRSLTQLTNVASLPGAHSCVYGMPDMHEGYGFPVGAVAAFRTDDGIVSPGGVGYDINCGVRLLASDIPLEAIGDKLEPIVHDLSRSIPSGTGRGGQLHLTDRELDRVFLEGCGYLVERELALPDDLVHTESGGCLPGADPARVSSRARQRGAPQLGTIGSGNHFVEVQVVDELFDETAGEILGLRRGEVTVLIHTGSRGLGHQICTDYVRLMDRVMPKYSISLPDRQLACAPIGSPDGQAYLGAMRSAANWAWANRQAITHVVRRVFRHHIGDHAHLRLIYDVAHNIAKEEEYGGVHLCVHRKGATRAFGPSHTETPEPYRSIGQPVFIPGSMGTASHVLVGADASATLSFGSCCHGAGRRMSRGAAKRTMPGREVRRMLTGDGIVVRCRSDKELAEEAPYAYKDVEQVVDVAHRVGLARRVVRLKPVGVLKG